jgi:hypothetical protein
MGRQAGDQSQLFYLFNLEQRRADTGAERAAWQAIIDEIVFELAPNARSVTITDRDSH